MRASDLDVRRLPADADLTAVHALGRDTFSPEAQCTPGAFWPSLRHLKAIQQAGGGIYVASHHGTDVGFIAVDADGQVAWLRATADLMGAVCTVCAPYALADFGVCWGPVGNPDVRAAVVEASAGRWVDEGPGTLRYLP